jgi:hypothetical protein
VYLDNITLIGDLGLLEAENGGIEAKYTQKFGFENLMEDFHPYPYTTSSFGYGSALSVCLSLSLFSLFDLVDG